MSEEKKGFFARLKEGLTKTRDNIVRGIDSVFSGFSAIDDDFYEELEEILISAHFSNASRVCVKCAQTQISRVKLRTSSRKSLCSE